MWSMASCRMFYIDYTTDRGDFSDFFKDPTADGEPVLQRVGAGLFTWLVPYAEDPFGNPNSDWTYGRCVGFSESQRNFFGDPLFEVSRVFAVLSVLGGMGLVLAVFILSCMSLKRFQIWMMTIIFGLIPIFVGLTFIVLQSKLCNGLTTYQNETYQTSCTVDQGGLVVIAAAIFWSVTFLISVVYIKDPKRDVGIRNGQITNAFETRQEERHLREMERRVKVQERREQRQERRNQRRKENGGSDNNDHDLRLEQDISDFDEDGEV
eukprot:CAMPEP_0168193172 /NCGR_PEP_ID=MMETSP0139_2-20121125/18452_1 /TAXON_ID=44445 /ORGANISM="Pseudo-nitzschia australis, Strain 10249 10 AB" /LENGTH=264 /DNA_ID=CAMNT_0008116485 /DNA_START=296 /DNA_END=1090 /DNA_ORIENTATION=-